MKKGFLSLILNAILVTSLCPGLVSAEQKDKKEKVQIIVVEKRNKGKSDNGGESRKPRHEGQQSL